MTAAASEKKQQEASDSSSKQKEASNSSSKQARNGIKQMTADKQTNALTSSLINYCL